MPWTILSTEQGSFETNKGPFYYVKAYVNESLSSGNSYSNPNIPSSVFSGKDVSIFASDNAFTSFESIDGSVKAIHDTSRDAYYLQFYENGTMFNEDRVGGAGSFIYNYGFVCWCMLIDPDGNGILQPNPVYLSSSNMQRISYNTAGSFGVVRINRDWYTSGTLTISATQNKMAAAILNAVPIQYNWKAWPRIGGNNGQYRCDLTCIKDASIGDFTGIVTGSASDFDVISSQSDVWGIFQNMSYGEERTIAWSGNAYMTLKLTAESQLPSYANFTFKFYSNQGSLLLTRTELVRWNGTSADVVIGLYLSFAYDDEQQSALFCPVIKMIDGTTYKWGYNNQYDATEMLNIWQWLHMSTAGEDDRPYDTGTTDNGGNPEGDILTNDDITNVNVPSLSALQTGMLTVYVPDDTELQHIASYLWSDNVIDNFKKYFNNFSDNIISLYVLPYKPSNLPNKPFKVGGLESTDLELASVDYITNRFVNIDMGEVDVGGLWNSYLDFSPYTKFNVYLPGIGVQAIDADDIMAPLDKNKNFGDKPGSKLKLDYVMDLMTGILVAYIKVNGQIRYQFSGKIGYQIPITGENYNNIVHAFTVAASGFVTTLASGGQTAPFALGAVAAAAINFNKPDVYRGGNLSGSASSMSYKHPYLIRRVPNKPQLVNQDKFTGFPTYKSGKLSDFGGYTEVVEVHAEGFVCTEEEREEIIELLKKGVIL